MYSNDSTISEKYPFGIHSFGLTEEQQEAKSRHFIDLIKNAKPNASFPKNRWQFDILAELLYDNFPRAATLHFFNVEYVYYFVNRYHFGLADGLPKRTKQEVRAYLNALIEDGFLVAWGERHYKKTARTHYIEPEQPEPEKNTYNAYGYGWLDGSLHGDAAVRRSLRNILQHDEPVSAEHARTWLQPFSPWRALAAAHLWAALRLQA